MSGINGVACGIVDSLQDPQGLGRIKVRLRGKPDEPASYWARIAAPMAGPGRGVQLMPEIGDEVLLAFDHGDLRLPFVLGYLWNGEDKPPRDKPQQRVIQTVSGHVFELDDTAGAEKISILFKGGLPGITLDQGSILIKLSDDCFVELTDTKLTVQLNGNSLIELTPASLKIVNSTLVDINP